MINIINKFKEAQYKTFTFWSVPKVISVSELKKSKGSKQIELLTNWITQVNSLDIRILRMTLTDSKISKILSSLQKTGFNIFAVLSADINKEIKAILLATYEKIDYLIR